MPNLLSLPVALVALIVACLAYGLAARCYSLIHRLDKVLADWMELSGLKKKEEK